MKRIVLFSVALCAAVAGRSQTRVYVDERQELSAIVWRLAGAEEYNTSLYEPYARDIETAFGAFRDHPLMRLIREMRDVPDSVEVVSYNSVPFSANLLAIRGGHVRLDPSIDLADFTARFDRRWKVDDLKRYARHLDDFYRRSHFDRFFRDHAEFYAQCTASVERTLAEKLRPEWFEAFYGVPFPELSVCVSPAGGVNNYALTPDYQAFLGRQGIGAVIGVAAAPDAAGELALPVLLHEISHSFFNPLFELFREQLLAAGERIYPQLPRMLTAAGYGAPEVIAGEFLNELLTMMYLRDVWGADLKGSIRRCERMGFIWAAEGVAFMDNFYANRALFPTIREFMPQLAGYMTCVGENIAEIKRAYNEPPRIVSVFPAAGTTVPADLKEVRIRFSCPMETGFTASKAPQTEGVLPILKPYDEDDDSEEEDAYWADDRTLVYRVGVALEPGRRYGVTVPGTYACRPNGVPMTSDYEVVFDVE